MASYRSLTASYYPDYAASAHAAAGYIGNGYFDVASPRSLTSIPYDAASQFNRYFEPEKVDCKYNPNSSESPKPEFGQPGGPQPSAPTQQPHPSSGKTDCQPVKSEPFASSSDADAASAAALAAVAAASSGISVDPNVVELQHHFPPVENSSAAQIILVGAERSLS